MTTIDVDELDDEHEQRRTFRYSNGAPLVSDPEDPEKTLRYSRPSGYSKSLDDEKALEAWRIWKSMTGVARSPALAAEVNACKDEDKKQKEALRNKALDKGDASEKADMGTALHAMTVRAEDSADVDFDPPEQYVPDLTAYTDALEAYGLVSEMFEVALVNDEFRAAGTADRIFRATKPLISPDGIRIEIGELILGDLKTGKMDFSMPNFCVQTFLYATGKLYDVITDRRLATPPINQNWSLLIHLPVGKAKCEVLWCPLEIGRIGAQMAREREGMAQAVEERHVRLPRRWRTGRPAGRVVLGVGSRSRRRGDAGNDGGVLPVPDRGDRRARPGPQVAADEVARGPAFPEERDHFG